MPSNECARRVTDAKFHIDTSAFVCSHPMNTAHWDYNVTLSSYQLSPSRCFPSPSPPPTTASTQALCSCSCTKAHSDSWYAAAEPGMGRGQHSHCTALLTLMHQATRSPSPAPWHVWHCSNVTVQHKPYWEKQEKGRAVFFWQWSSFTWLMAALAWRWEQMPSETQGPYGREEVGCTASLPQTHSQVVPEADHGSQAVGSCSSCLLGQHAALSITRHTPDLTRFQCREDHSALSKIRGTFHSWLRGFSFLNVKNILKSIFRIPWFGALLLGWKVLMIKSLI